MKDYSYSELKDMQIRAMERVRAMQQRADETITAAGNDLINTSEQNHRGNEPPDRTQRNDKPHHIKMPTNMPPRENSQYKPFSDFFNDSAKQNQNTVKNENGQNTASPAQQNQGVGAILENIMNEPDRAMLLPLLLLLRSEGSDEALMMSLLYIMS